MLSKCCTLKLLISRHNIQELCNSARKDEQGACMYEWDPAVLGL